MTRGSATSDAASAAATNPARVARSRAARATPHRPPFLFQADLWKSYLPLALALHQKRRAHAKSVAL